MTFNFIEEDFNVLKMLISEDNDLLTKLELIADEVNIKSDMGGIILYKFSLDEIEIIKIVTMIIDREEEENAIHDSIDYIIETFSRDAFLNIA